MGDRVAVLKDGILQQVDTPRRMYAAPANVFVAGFIGSPAMNVRRAPLVEGGADLGHGVRVPLSRSALDAVGFERGVTVRYRPESLDIVPEGTPGAFPVLVQVVEELGAEAFVYAGATGPDGSVASGDVVARVAPHLVPEKGERIFLRIRDGEQHLFSVGTGERIAP